MANEKTYSAQEAALAVLAKTQELLNKSEFMKAEKMKKDGSIQSGIAAAGGGGNAPINSGVTSSLGSAFGKKELAKKYEGFKAVEESAKESGARDPGAVAAAVGRKKYGKEAFQHAAAAGKKMGKGENPDEKQDAQLGEDVEHLCMDHAEHNKMDKCVHKSECIKCMGKSEYTELYASLAKMEEFQKGEAPSPKPEKERDPASDKAQGAGNKEQPSSPPADHSKPIERDHSDFETKPGHSNAPDHREEPQTPPQANPKEQHEGNNPAAGSVPGNGIHKLMYFCGHSKAKKNMKKGIALG